MNGELVKIKEEESYYCFDWIVQLGCTCNSCIRIGKYDNILSPSFTTRSILADNWYLYLSISLENPIFFTVKLNNSSNLLKCIDNCLIKIGIRSAQDNMTYHNTEYENLRKLMTNEYFSSYIKLKFVNYSSSTIRNCNFERQGKLIFTVEIFKRTVKVTSIDIQNPITNTQKVLKNLQVSEKFSDVTLVVGDREFRAHKAVLATQSSVFSAMFEHDMKEKVENKVIIEDIKGEIMQEILNYMYLGSVDKEQFKDLDACDLLVAADKYALEDLQKICEKILVEKLNNENVFKVLQTANSYELNSLKKSAVNYVARQIEDLIQTTEFNNLSMDLIKEIVLAVKNMTLNV